jgi:hypothetical protein
MYIGLRMLSKTGDSGAVSRYHMAYRRRRCCSLWRSRFIFWGAENYQRFLELPEYFGCKAVISPIPVRRRLPVSFWHAPSMSEVLNLGHSGMPAEGYRF